MTRATVASLALSAVLCAAAVTPAAAQSPAAKPAPKPQADCFRMSEMENHTVGDAKTLYLNVRSHKVYRLDMVGSCLAGKTGSDPLIIRQHGPSDIICRPLDLDISVASGTGPGSFASPCLVSSLTKLTPAEVAALPKNKRP